MSSEMYGMVEEAAKELRRQQARLKAISRKLEGSVTKVSSKDRMVTVTIGQAGNLETIEFNSEKYRSEALNKQTVAQLQQEYYATINDLSSPPGSTTTGGPTTPPGG